MWRAQGGPLVLAAALCAVLPALSGATVRVPLQRTAFQETVRLPLADSTVRGNYNLVLVAEEGHGVDRAVKGICDGIGASFNVTGDEGAVYAARCPSLTATMVRESRGLDMQHDPV